GRGCYCSTAAPRPAVPRFSCVLLSQEAYRGEEATWRESARLRVRSLPARLSQPEPAPAGFLGLTMGFSQPACSSAISFLICFFDTADRLCYTGSAALHTQNAAFRLGSRFCSQELHCDID